MKVVKNKVAAPFKEAEFDIMFGEGISGEGEVVDLGSDIEVITKSGTWFSIDGERIGQGRENAKQYLRDNPEKYEEIKVKVRDACGIGPNSVTVEPVEEEQTEE